MTLVAIPAQVFKERNLEELEAAKLLLSVSPTCRPATRPRSLSLDTLCDVALGETSNKEPQLSSVRISPSSSTSPASLTILSSLKRAALPIIEEENDTPNKRTRRSTRVSNFASIAPKKIGAYTLEERKERIARFVEKRNKRIWVKKVRYSCRKNLAECRTRVKGRFVSSKGMKNPTSEDDDVHST